MLLYNRINNEELKNRLANETFSRKTLSFYRYRPIDDPLTLRDELYRKWSGFNCFGRIYIAYEGINAQMSVPDYNVEEFITQLETIPDLSQIPIKYSISENGKSFFKLTVKIRNKIVADGLADDQLNIRRTNNYITAKEFNELSGKPDTVLLDMRNAYEFEIGHFKHAISPNARTFKDTLRNALTILDAFRSEKIILYCTGGIRCEKASSWLMKHGFADVYQLEGGIVGYIHQVRALNIESKFIGKNFVFDERLGETTDGNIIASCHQCGRPCDHHTNCENTACHRLIIQCNECCSNYGGCCSEACFQTIHRLFETS